MKIGLLETGNPPGDLAETHGSYSAMFEALLAYSLGAGAIVSKDSLLRVAGHEAQLPAEVVRVHERIRALLRRGEIARGGADIQAEPVIQRGDLTLDPGRHQCTWKSQDVDLTVTEFLILKSLAVRPGHVKSRDQLMDSAYGEHIYVDDRTIDSHIKRLRKKFKAVDTDFVQIETLYGVGYRYRDH